MLMVIHWVLLRTSGRFLVDLFIKMLGLLVFSLSLIVCRLNILPVLCGETSFKNIVGVLSIPKCLLHNIYRTLLNDSSAAVSSDQAAVDERVAQALLELDDPDIIMDLRRFNGKAKNCQFDPFWDELQAFLDEVVLAVDERRHGDVLHMPFATSLRHLRDLVHDRLKINFPIISAHPFHV